MKVLAELLKLAHGLNCNGVLLTDYSKIPGLKVSASTTNGTTGIGTWKGRRVYWWFNHTQNSFIVEPN